MRRSLQLSHREFPLSEVFCLQVKKNEYFRLKREHLRLRREQFVRCMKTGTPIALQNALVSVSMISLQKTANSFGDIVVAAYTATMRVEQLIQQPFNSLGTALSTFAGQNVGAAKAPDRVVKGYHRSMLISTAFGLLMLGVFAFTSRYIVGFFVIEEPGYRYRCKGAFAVCLLLCSAGLYPHDKRTFKRCGRCRICISERTCRGNRQE